MAQDLKAVIRMHKFQVDELRRAMGVLLGREGEILGRRAALDEELVKEKEAVKEAAEPNFDFGAYFNHYMDRRKALNKALAAIQREIAAAQDVLANAFKELKTLQITQENRDREAAEEQARKNQNALDEIAMNLHRRRTEAERDR